MDMNRMTLKAQEALQAASALAMYRNHQGIDVEHVLMALLEQPDGSAGPILEQSGVSGSAVKAKAGAATRKTSPGPRDRGGARTAASDPTNRNASFSCRG